MFESPPFWMYIAGFLLVLGPLVTVHELGHYLVGRWFGVKADAFSIGFGNEIVGWTDKQGTRWKLATIPLGGYVQFKGDMNPASMADPHAPAAPDAFQSQALWKRTLIVFAGPATNLIVAVGIFFAFFAISGQPTVTFPDDSTVVDRFADESAARDAGVEVGDRITAIDGRQVDDFQQLIDQVALYPNRQIDLTVERDGDAITLPVTIGSAVEEDRFGNEITLGRLGVYRPDNGMPDVTYQRLGVVEALPAALKYTWNTFEMMMLGLKQIMVGDRSIQELGGPVKIAKYSGEQLSLGLIAFVNFAALISLNLAFINLLPIPALDGGHLAFYAAEAVRKKPVGPRATELAYRTGIAIVLMLMVVVTFNDLVSLPIFGS
ncbi:RIP metalloprotease RseP [Altererythrobacter ishigakiensis]|uniref:Zinc metalloprotease n=2 Tax=Altererythrobacter ishigakiensis TaxID=476157 RepID=A0A562UVV3_9SPHN|nr:RIP metalloprotease RseP [Altererythrobacter ishigakiensis]TWJ09745.1 regulator of sigma E protease [Altererythrobacter ishigakiensis]